MRRTIVAGLCGLAVGALAVAGGTALRASSREEATAVPAAPAADLPPATQDAPPADRSGTRSVEVDMQNVDLQMTGGIVMHVQALRGRLADDRPWLLHCRAPL